MTRTVNSRIDTRIPAPACVSLLLVAALAGCASPADGPAAPSGETSSRFSELEVGACITIDPDAAEFDFEDISCEEPHQEQIFHEIEVPDGEYDVIELDQLVEKECLGDAFTDFVGVTKDESSLSVLPIFPTEKDWDSGARAVYCAVSDDAGPTSGTLEGSGR